ncbi:hypothetical protein CYMTET_16464, partial [Cymbomonas tetramitiformis]
MLAQTEHKWGHCRKRSPGRRAQGRLPGLQKTKHKWDIVESARQGGAHAGRQQGRCYSGLQKTKHMWDIAGKAPRPGEACAGAATRSAEDQAQVGTLLKALAREACAGAAT